MKNCPTIEKCVVVKRTKEDVAWEEGRDLWWHELEENASKEHEALPRFDSEHPLYRTYTAAQARETESRFAHLRRYCDTRGHGSILI